METIERTFRITSIHGLHGRTSARLVETARRFASEIRLIRDGMEADGKNILDVMTLACVRNTPVTVRVRGEDAPRAMAAIEQLVRENFGEEGDG